MNFAVSTRWNATHHRSGEEMVDEILSLGVRHVELGYDTRLDLLPGITSRIEEGAIDVVSVHNYCPVPMGVPKGHPELWTFATPDKRAFDMAVQHTLRTMQFAAEVGAGIVVIHCGYVQMKRPSTHDLMDYIQMDQQNSQRYEKVFMKFIKQREKRANRHLDHIYKALDILLPQAEALNVRMGLENLPTLEAIPNEEEMSFLLQQFQSPWLKYWHDLGHAQIRENLGYINHVKWLERIAPHLGGMHIHDVSHKLRDHVMPPHGDLGLQRYAPFARPELPLVIEPSPRSGFNDIATGLAWIRHWWDDGPRPPEPEDPVPSPDHPSAPPSS